MKDKKQSKEMEPRGGQAGQPPCGQLTSYLVFFLSCLSLFTHMKFLYDISLVHKQAYSRLGNPFSPGFLTRSTNSGLKGPFFSPGW